MLITEIGLSEIEFHVNHGWANADSNVAYPFQV